jgi:DNA-binding GntR family transcriptional regulator
VAVENRSRLTKQERVYQAIRERILSGAYSPGYRVVIDALADEFNVSALPVREAIRRLEAEGLVIFRPNAGAQVAPADPGQFIERTDVLAVLEGYATALAAPHIDEAGIANLEAINAEMVEAMERLDSVKFGRLNHDFHAFICERCPNAVLVDMLRDVTRQLDAIRRTVFVHIPYRGAASVAEHRNLIALIREGAPAAKIEAAARNHKLTTLETFREWQREHDLA